VRWLSVPISVIVFLVLTASTACVVRCVGVPCHGTKETAKLPPCHKEKGRESPVYACEQSVLIAKVAETLTLTKPTTLFVPVVGVETSTVALLGRIAAAAQENIVPPGSWDLHFSVVLRI
jgi:hypothetical protein